MKLLIGKMNVIIEEYETMKKLKSSLGKFFVQYTATSKYTMIFDLNIDVQVFKPELVTIKLKCISFPYEDSYGEIDDFYIINDFKYADMYDSLIDRGYDREIILIETEDEVDGEIYMIQFSQHLKCINKKKE